MKDNFLEQLITGPTHDRGNTLDLLLCNCPEIIHNVIILSPEQSNFPTDHYIIEFQIRQTFRHANPVPRNVYDISEETLMSFEAF